MREYNDYISITRRYLKNYNQFKISVENMQDDIKYLEESIDRNMNIAAPISRYGDEPSGGTSELNAVERAADQRMHMEKQLDALKLNVKELTLRIRKIDRAIDSLKKEDSEIIKEFYFDDYDWEFIGHTHSLSPKRARDRGGAALKQIAFMIFGVKAKPYGVSFIFAD